MNKFKLNNFLFALNPNKNYLFVLFFSIIISLFFGFAYYITRLGLTSTNYKFILVNILISIFILIFPSIFLILFNNYFRKYRFSFLGIEAFFSICGLIILIFLSYVPNFNIKIIFLILIDLILISHFLYNLFSQKILKINIGIYILIIIFSIWLFSTIWGKTFLSTYNHPLFKESILTGNAFIDPLYHSAMSNMLKTYNIPSTGLDGVPYIPYHFFTHWLFAKFSSIGNINTIDFFQIGYPIIFVPLLFKHLITIIIELREYSNKSNNSLYKNFFFWLLFTIIFTSIFPKFILEKFFIYPDLLINESYNIGFYLIFIIFSLTIFFFNASFDNKIDVIKKIFFIIIIPIFTFLIGITKGPFMIILVFIFAYIFLRLSLFKKKVYIFAFINMLICAYLSYRLLSESIPLKINIFHFFKTAIIIRNIELPKIITIILFLIIYFLWAYILSFIKFKNIKNDPDSLLQKIKKKKILDLEILFILIVIGILPGILFELQTGSATYFSSVQKWFSIILLLIYFPFEKINNCKYASFNIVKNKFYKLFSIFGVILLILLFIFNTTFSVIDYAKYSNQIKKSYIQHNSSEDNKKFNFTKNLLIILESLDNLPVKIKKETFIYIPHLSNNSIFWKLDLLSKILGTPFIIPAVSGIALIDGVPDEDLVYRKFWGYAYYETTKASDRVTDLEKIFINAQSKGAKEVIIIDYYYLKDKLVTNIMNINNYKDMDIISFIKRNYIFVLNKYPSENEVYNLLTLIKSEILKPEELSSKLIINNNEFTKSLSDKEFIEYLYIILLNRQYDEPGLKGWISSLRNNHDKELVFNGFIESEEFKKIFN